VPAALGAVDAIRVPVLSLEVGRLTLGVVLRVGVNDSANQ
jgi:hypothetical protein